MSDTVVQFKHKNDLTGTTLGQYRIVQHLGRGGMADVYKAEHVGLSVFRTIKVVRPEFVANNEFSARFKTEAQAVAMLRHNNIVQLQDFCFENDMFYMVMEFIDGQNLTECLQEEGPMRPVERAVHMISQIASALHYAHSQGLVHRDIKPANILLNSSGVPILTDFGIAKLLESGSDLTRPGSSIGTPNYMAPEQAKGGRGIGPAADVYSLAVVLFEILTGVVPYEAPTPVATLMKALHDPIPRPQQFCPEISNALQNVIMQGMAKSPEDRFITALAFQRALDATLRSSEDDKHVSRKISARVPAIVATPRKTGQVRRRRSANSYLAPVAGVVAGFAVVGLVAGGVWFFNDPASPYSSKSQNDAAGDLPVLSNRRTADSSAPENSGAEESAGQEVQARYTEGKAIGLADKTTDKENITVPSLVNGGDVKFNRYTERSIEVPGQQVQYTFLGEEGQTLYFESRHFSKNTVLYSLLAPDQNTKLFERDVDAGPVLLNQTGTYTLRVDPLVDTPVYVEFVLWDLDPPIIDGGKLAIDEVTENRIDRPGQKASYTFEAVKGQDVILETRMDERFHVDYLLTAPDEKTIVFAGKESTGRVPLPQSGTYTLLVNPINTFNFKFNLELK